MDITKHILSKLSYNIMSQVSDITGMTANAEKDTGNPDHVKACLSRINASAHELMNLVNDMLAIGKLESGVLSIEDSDFSLYQLIDAFRTRVQLESDAKDLDFCLSLNHIYHDELIGDPLKIQHIMENILSNALKFTPHGGSINVNITESPSHLNNRVHFTITCQDTGIGMDAATLRNLFDPFNRDIDPNKPEQSGSGISMFITKALVDLMGGSINVESSPGKGSVFTVDLDLETQSFTLDTIGSASATAAAPLMFDQMRFLIAEDSQVSMKHTVDLLIETGAAVECAFNGQEALDMYLKNPAGHYNLILMDLQMPVMDGLESTKAIRASGREDAKSIPILAMTTSAFSEVLTQSMEAGMNAHISKPLNLIEMLVAMENLLQPAPAED